MALPSAPAAPIDGADRFLEAVSRELREPLGGIMAIAGLLQRQPLAGEGGAYVRMILEHSQAMARALEDARDLVSAERGALTLSPAPVSLREMMDALQGEWQAQAAAGGVSLMVAYDGEDLLVNLDGARLRQVFDHLIQHALKRTRRGGVEASLRARKVDEGVVLEGAVRDCGEPIPAESLARIFEVRTGEADTGVGLAISRRVIEAMHGAIRAECNAGAGATIAFSLIAEAAEVEEQDEADGSEALRDVHVLVVDDNATNRMVAEALCEMFGCACESAADGLEAVEKVKRGRFDLILMDIKMPRMDGVEATRTIRALPGARGATPIIALTANADPEDAKGYIAAGMCQVVEKPIKAEALLEAISASVAPAPASGARAAAAA